MRNNYLFPALVLILLFSGCSGLRPETDPLLDSKARHIAVQAKKTNQDIKTSKGIGWIALKTAEGNDTFRALWAAAYPNRLRITFMVSGHPFETIVANGKNVTFVSHTGQHSEHTTYLPDPDLEPYINIKVRLSEIVSLLLGRLPIKDFDDIYFDPEDQSLSTIALYDNHDGLIQRLYLDQDDKVNAIAPTDYTNNSLFDLKILKYNIHALKTIPSSIEVIDKNKNRMLMEISRFIPNTEVKESVFRLTEPGK